MPDPIPTADPSRGERAPEFLPATSPSPAPFHALDDGFCVVEVLFAADGRPRDYRFLEANPAFERHTGLRDAVGRTAREMVPELEERWFETYGRVAASRRPERFVDDARPMGGRTFDVVAFSVGEPEQRRVGILFTDVSARRRAEDALRVSEERSRRILESITDAFFALDRAWRFTYANPQAARVLEREVGDLPGRVIWEEYPGLAGSAFERAYRRAMDEGASSSVTAFYPDHDRWYEVHAFPAPDGVTVFFRDVSESVRSTEALEASEERMRLAVAANRMVAWEWTPATDAIVTTDNFSEIYGLPALSGVAEGMALVWPEDLPAHQERVGRIAAEGGEYRSEYRITRPSDGQTVWLEERARALTDEAGRVVRVVGVVTDVSERRRADEAVRVSEERYRTLFASIDEGFCVVEVLFADDGTAVDFRFLETNPAFERQSGLREAVGKRMREIAPGHEGFWFETYGRVATTGEPERFVHHAAALGDRWFEVFAFRVGDPADRQVAILFADVSARRRAEAALRAVAERDAFLVALGDALRPLTDADAVQVAAARLLGEHLGASRVHYAEATGRGDEVLVRHEYREPGVASVAGVHRLSWYGPRLEAAYRRGQTTASADIPRDPEFAPAERDAAAAIGVAAFLAVPVLRGGDLAGLLVVHDGEPRRWTADEVALAEETARRTWDAVERARAEGRVRRRSVQLQALAEATLTVSRAPTLAATLDEITREARRIVGAHQAVVSLTDGPDWRQAINAVELSDAYAAWRGYATMPDGSGIYAWVCEQNRPARMTQAELEAHPRWRAFGSHAADHPPMRGWLAAPLVGRDGRNLGLIQLSDKDDGGEFDADDEAMLVQLAQFASGAIERAQAEAALRAGEERLRLALDAADLGVYAWDATSDRTFVDDRVRDIVGIGPDAPFSLGAALADAIHPDDRARYAAAVRAMLDPVGPGRLAEEVRWRDDAGGECWLAFSGQAFFDQAGDDGLPRLSRVVGVVRDVTARRRADEAVRASEERFRTLIQRSADAIQLVAADGTILYSSDSVEAVLGYRPDEIAGRSVAPYLHPDDLPGVTAWLTGVAAEPGAVASLEYRVRHKDGGWAWVETTIANHLETPNVGAIVGNFRNVTARKELERQKDEFVAVATHELKTPVTSIKGYAQLLRNRFRRAGDERAAAMMETLDGQIDRLSTLVGDLVDATKVESGHLRLEPTRFDLDALVDEAVAGLQVTTDRHRLRREGRAGAEIVADRDRVGQVLTNLLSNAIKYAPAGGDVVVSVAADAAAATVCVRDRGIGIPAAEVDRVFDRFYRIGGGHANAAPGLGLGLYISAEIVRRHGGRIWAESVEGEGSTFCVRLPWRPPADG